MRSGGGFKGKSGQILQHVLREVGVPGGHVLRGYWSDQAETFREGVGEVG